MSIHITHADLTGCFIGNTVLTTVTNSGYLLYTLNLLKSIRPYGLDQKILLVCLDSKAAATLRSRGYHRIIEVQSSLHKFCPWNTKGYDEICYLKLELVYRILSLSVNVVLIDGDIVFLRSPLEDLQRWQEDLSHDVWIQNDSQTDRDHENLCTGYLFIKASDKMISLYDCVSEKGKRIYQLCAFDNNDQTYFNRFIKPYCRVHALPLNDYPNGKMFYDHSSLEQSAVLLHFNWVKGHEKMAKMKEHKKWLLEEDEEV